MSQQKKTRAGSFESIHDMPLDIDWLLTKMCNYRCSYCYWNNMEEHKINKLNFSTNEQIMKAIEHISELNRSMYNIVLAGGEPTIHPHFLDIVNTLFNKLGTRLNNLTIVSNGSSDINLYKRIAYLSNTYNINLVVSIHSEFVKLDKIIKLIQIFSKFGTLSINHMFNFRKRDVVKKIFNLLLTLRKSYLFHTDILLLRQPPLFTQIDANYSKEDYEWRAIAQQKWRDICSAYPKPKEVFVKSKGYKYFQMIDGKFEDILQPPMWYGDVGNFSDMYCCSGTTTLSIDDDGSCYSTICDLRYKSKYNIFSNNPYMDDNFIKSIYCTLEYCPCGCNYSMQKFSDRVEAEQYIKMFKENQCKLLHINS